MEKRILIDRAVLMGWVDGILVDRKRDCSCLVLDDAEVDRKCKAAEKAMDAGKTIYLTQGGKVVSKMKLEGEGDKAGYMEEAV
jgi:hypothetical protein